MTKSFPSDLFNFVDETTNYNYDSYKCQNWYLVNGIKCFVTPLNIKGVEPIAQSDDLKAYTINNFTDFARQYNLSESEANEYHVTDNEENDYTKVIPFGSNIELTQIDYQGLNDDTCVKTVWHKASVNNNVHYYTINGVKVFLAYESDMQGVEPYEVNSPMGINAYRLEDFREGVDTEHTYYESYGGEYPDSGYEICIADVVNAENDQYVLFDQWICVDELDEVNEELHARGFKENDIPNELLNDKDKEVLQTIKDYELSTSNTLLGYQFSRIIPLDDDATLYLFQFGDVIKSSAISYADGTTFVLGDWQGSRPESAEEIADYDWRLASNGRRAIVMDGLPRIL